MRENCTSSLCGGRRPAQEQSSAPPPTRQLGPTNKAERSAAELVEPRTGTKGNADRQSTHWTQSQARVSQALERIRQAVAVTHPRWEPHAGKPHVRICAGGARQLASLPLRRRSFITDLGSTAAWPMVAHAQQQTDQV